MDVCPHLEPVLKHELARGNKIVDSSEAWAETRLSVTLERSMDVESAKHLLSDKVTHWKSLDTHYVLEEGFFCTECKHSLAGPVRGNSMGRDLVDGVLVEWILEGGDFRKMLEDVLAASGLGAEQRQQLRDGGDIGFAQLQGANLDRLRRMKENMDRLRCELAAILRW